MIQIKKYTLQVIAKEVRSIQSFTNAIFFIKSSNPFIRDFLHLHSMIHLSKGATAKVTSSFFANKYSDINVKTIVFGSPRVGNQNYKNWSNNISNLSLWQFVYMRDIVPRVPFNKHGYKHEGHLMQLEWKGVKAYYHFTGKDNYKGITNRWKSESNAVLFLFKMHISS